MWWSFYHIVIYVLIPSFFRLPWTCTDIRGIKNCRSLSANLHRVQTVWILHFCALLTNPQALKDLLWAHCCFNRGEGFRKPNDFLGRSPSPNHEVSWRANKTIRYPKGRHREDQLWRGGSSRLPPPVRTASDCCEGLFSSDGHQLHWKKKKSENLQATATKDKKMMSEQKIEE